MAGLDRKTKVFVAVCAALSPLGFIAMARDCGELSSLFKTSSPVAAPTMAAQPPAAAETDPLGIPNSGERPRDGLRTQKKVDADQNGVPTEAGQLVSARSLAAAYDDNEPAAERKYGDKRIVVTGRVEKVTKSVLDDTVVYLGHEVQAFLRSTDEDAATRLRRGQKVVVECDCCKTALGYVGLTECELRAAGGKSSAKRIDDFERGWNEGLRRASRQ